MKINLTSLLESFAEGIALGLKEYDDNEEDDLMIDTNPIVKYLESLGIEVEKGEE